MAERFQVTIVGPNTDALVPADESPFQVTQHSRGGAAVERIDDLARIWDQVIAKLTDLASQSSVVAAASQFKLNEIEFHVGIEAGLSVGLVTKGDASVSIKFGRVKSEDGQSEAP